MERISTIAAVAQVAEIELVYKSKVKPTGRPQIKTSADAYGLFKQCWDENRIEYVEQFKVMYVNKAHRALAIYELSTGGLAGTVADQRQVFAAALKINASGIFLCHNHPSFNLQPSREDKEVTCRIKEGGRLLGITVLDHLIISPEAYLSFADEGLM